MTKILYFAYGSNLHPEWLRSRTPSAEILNTETLQKWKLHFHKCGLDSSAKCNIVKTDSVDDSVHGVIYQFNSDEKEKLDEAEYGYSPERMQIGEYENVLVYLNRNDRSSDNLLPYTWYKDIVIAGAQYHNFPEEYIEFVKSFKATIDPDQERERKRRLIVWSR